MPAAFLLFWNYSHKIGHLLFLNYAGIIGAGLSDTNMLMFLSKNLPYWVIA